MTFDEVRAIILRKAQHFGKYKGASGVTAWGNSHDISRGHLSEFMNGKRGPDTKILDALGLEWRICRKRSATVGRHNIDAGVV